MPATTTSLLLAVVIFFETGLLSPFTQAHARSQEANRECDVQDCLSKSIDKLIDRLPDRALNMLSWHHAELDNTLLGKSAQKQQDDITHLSQDVPKLPLHMVERGLKKEIGSIAAHELSQLWMYKTQDRERVKDFFECMRNPNWHLERKDKNGYEVWRLPGEKIHRIMGVKTLNAPPSVAFKDMKSPELMLETLVPKLDPMFIEGEIFAEPAPGRALCHAAFKIPAPIGSGAAPILFERDFIWDQRLTKLKGGGNMLFTAQSIPDDKALSLRKKFAPIKKVSSQSCVDQWIENVGQTLSGLPFAKELQKAIGGERPSGVSKSSEEVGLPKRKGAIRGDLHASGYFGKEISSADSSKKTRLYFIVQADPKGILPKWLVNMAVSKQAENVKRWAQLYGEPAAV